MLPVFEAEKTNKQKISSFAATVAGKTLWRLRSRALRLNKPTPADLCIKRYRANKIQSQHLQTPESNGTEPTRYRDNKPTPADLCIKRYRANKPTPAELCIKRYRANKIQSQQFRPRYQTTVELGQRPPKTEDGKRLHTESHTN